MSSLPVPHLCWWAMAKSGPCSGGMSDRIRWGGGGRYRERQAPLWKRWAETAAGWGWRVLGGRNRNTKPQAQGQGSGSGSGLFQIPEGDMVGLNVIRAHIILSLISFHPSTNPTSPYFTAPEPPRYPLHLLSVVWTSGVVNTSLGGIYNSSRPHVTSQGKWQGITTCLISLSRAP